MFSTMSNPAAAYRKAGIETSVETTSPHQLVLMLFDGAVHQIKSAGLLMKNGDIQGKGNAIGKAIDIIENGLRACLDYKAGGDLAERLGALYEYMCMRLLHANLNNDQSALDEVLRLVGEIRSAWAEIADDPAVHQRNRAASL